MLVRHLVEQLQEVPEDMQLTFDMTIGKKPVTEVVVLKVGDVAIVRSC